MQLPCSRGCGQAKLETSSAELCCRRANPCNNACVGEAGGDCMHEASWWPPISVSPSEASYKAGCWKASYVSTEGQKAPILSVRPNHLRLQSLGHWQDATPRYQCQWGELGPLPHHAPHAYNGAASSPAGHGTSNSMQGGTLPLMKTCQGLTCSKLEASQNGSLLTCLSIANVQTLQWALGLWVHLTLVTGLVIPPQPNWPFI